jgi:hypothetical protein
MSINKIFDGFPEWDQKNQQTPEQVISDLAKTFDEASKGFIKSRIVPDLVFKYSDDDNDEVYQRVTWSIYIPVPGGYWQEIIRTLSQLPNTPYPVTIEAFYSYSSNKSIQKVAADADSLKTAIEAILEMPEVQGVIYEMYRKAQQMKSA